MSKGEKKSKRKKSKEISTERDRKIKQRDRKKEIGRGGREREGRFYWQMHPV